MAFNRMPSHGRLLCALNRALPMWARIRLARHLGCGTAQVIDELRFRGLLARNVWNGNPIAWRLHVTPDGLDGGPLRDAVLGDVTFYGGARLYNLWAGRPA